MPIHLSHPTSGVACCCCKATTQIGMIGRQTVDSRLLYLSLISYLRRYSPLNIRKALLPKLSSLLRNAFNRNAQAICPNLLPFLSKITAESLQDLDLYEFYQRFFDDLKSAVVGTHEPPLSKADISIIHNAYFECLRFMLQQINNNAQRTAAMEEFGYGLLEHQLLEPIGNLLHSESNHVKYFFQHTSALVAFWDRECNTNSDKSASSLYVQLLNKFWTRIFDLVTQDLAVEDVNEQLLSHVLLLVQDLHVANPSLETQSVKFVEVDEEETTKVASQQSTPTRKAHDAAAFIQKELKQLVVKLVRICLDKASSSSNSARFIRQVRTLTKMFTDAEFYKSLTERGELHATLDKFVSILGKLNDDACESVVDILFEILSLQEPVPRFEYIGGTLLKVFRRKMFTKLKTDLCLVFLYYRYNKTVYRIYCCIVCSRIRYAPNLPYGKCSPAQTLAR